MDPEDHSVEDENKKSQRDAAANVVRLQLDSLYSGEPQVTQPSPEQAEPQAKLEPYRPQTDHLKQYHSQWQNYYQKYYERYYVGKLHEAIDEHDNAKKSPSQKDVVAREELKQKIIDNAKIGAKKARKSRHFIPIVSAVLVVLLVTFLQYNQIIFANVQAYVSPGAIDPQNIIVDPGNLSVPPGSKLIIPKINVDVPIIDNVSDKYADLMSAMQKGVAHFAIPGANSEPGQLGNTVFSGHSSNDLFDPGDYKFIFVQLDNLQIGDTIYVNYNSIRYTYTVTSKQVVAPTDVQALLGHNDKPYITLITCTPVGTALHRLLVTAEQVSPDPSQAKTQSAATSGGSTGTKMPGQDPTVLERLFGAN